MMEWMTVIMLIVVGIILLITELIFIPGTTVIGILGLVFVIAGVYFGFEYFSSTIGMYVLGGTLLVTGITMYFGFKSKAWERFSLKDTMEGRVNEGLSLELNIGEEGVASSTLKPIGKAEFNNKEFEVRTIGNYLNAGSPVRIIKIESNKIFVEPIN